jgi:hypothetical protein
VQEEEEESNMTDSDKELIADYMGWRWCKLRERYTRVVDGERIVINWDMNDAGLCVQKMVEKGDWEEFDLFYSMAEWLSGRRNIIIAE